MASADLGAVVSIDDQTAAGANSIARSLANVGAGMVQLTRETVGLNQALQFIDTGTGRVVSTFDALKAAGIVTTGELKNQIAAYDLLIARTKDDAAATAQLVARQKGLKNALAGTTSRMRGGTTSALDAQQAFTGFGLVLRGISTGSLSSATFGLTQFSNNLAVIKTRADGAGRSVKSVLISALKGGGGLALALTAAGLAFEFFNRGAKEAEENIDKLALTSAGLVLPDLRQFEFDPTRALGAIKEAEADIKRLNDALDITSRIRGRSTGGGRGTLENIPVRDVIDKEVLAIIDAVIDKNQTLIDDYTETIEKVRALKERNDSLALTFKEIEKTTKSSLTPLAEFNERINRIAERIEPGFAGPGFSDLVDDMREAKREARDLQDVLDVFNRPPPGGRTIGVGLEDSDQVRADAELTLAQMQKLEQQIIALDIARLFIDPFSEGLADIILGLGNVNDLLDGMKRAFADLLALGFKGLLGAGIGALFGNPLAGLSIATGIDFQGSSSGRQLSQGASPSFTATPTFGYEGLSYRIERSNQLRRQ